MGLGAVALPEYVHRWAVAKQVVIDSVFNSIIQQGQTRLISKVSPRHSG